MTDLRFVAVLERHKERNVPHIHGFTNLWMKQAEWSKMWDECGGGRVVWVERVKSAHASEYVSKQINVARYVSKDTLRASYKLSKRFHTLWRSKSTKADFELTEGSEWCILKETVYNEDGSLTVFYASKGAESDGKEKRGREDVEATRSPLLEQSTQASFPYMETEEPESESGESQETA